MFVGLYSIIENLISITVYRMARQSTTNDKIIYFYVFILFQKHIIRMIAGICEINIKMIEFLFSFNLSVYQPPLANYGKALQ